MHKLENPARLAELQPSSTLKKLGLQEGLVFADIGAGTGIFTTAAAEITRAPIYAIDPSERMREIIQEKKDRSDFQQIELLSDVAQVPKGNVDLALLCTVLHEIENQEAFLQTIAERLKPEGRLAIIEFHKSASLFGPPLAIRLSPEDVTCLAAAARFVERERFTLGENLYCVCFGKE